MPADILSVSRKNAPDFRSETAVNWVHEYKVSTIVRFAFAVTVTVTATATM
jgi:hypothetical protein